MNGLLLGIVVGLVPALLAAKLPRRRKRLGLDRKIAIGLQAAGVLALVGGVIWFLWLIPQLFMSAGCGITSGLLMVLSLFTVSLPCHNLTSRRSQAVAIDDDSALPAEWLTVKTTTSPDKAAIKAALKAGHTIPGATLLSRRTWHIH